jgi:hypothetical protein
MNRHTVTWKGAKALFTFFNGLAFLLQLWQNESFLVIFRYFFVFPYHSAKQSLNILNKPSLRKESMTRPTIS